MSEVHPLRRALAQFIGPPAPAAATPVADAGSLFGRVMSMLNGDLTLIQLVAAFEREDLGDVVRSWIARGENRPISSDQLERVLGRERIAKLAADAGLPYASAIAELTQMLPIIVDKLTPLGELSKGLLRRKAMPLTRTPGA